MSAQSGVHVPDEVVKQYNKMKLEKHIKYSTFKLTKNHDAIENGVSVADDESKPEEAHWKEFVDSLKDDECCYAVYDCAFRLEGSDQRKLVFITWAPDSSNVKQKMVTSSSKDALKKKFEGVHKEIQANDKDDLKYSDLMGKMKY